MVARSWKTLFEFHHEATDTLRTAAGEPADCYAMPSNGPGRDYGRPNNTGVKIPATRVPLGFHRMSVHSPRC